MPVDRVALAEAAAAHLEPLVGERLRDAWNVTCPQPQTDETDAALGLALAVAMCPLPPQIAAKQMQELGLSEVTLHEVGVSLTPREAYRHPLVSAWLSSTFGDMVGEVVSAGRIASNIGMGAPLYDSLNIVVENGRLVSALARMIFPAREGALTVDLRFGAMASNRLSQITLISGDSLFSVGAAMRGAGETAPRPAPSSSRTPDGGEALQ